MANDKLKNLGQTAAEMPQALQARIEQMSTAAASVNRVFISDAYLQAEAQARYQKIDEQIRSFNTDVETEFEQLHTIAEKLLKRLDTAAEDVDEGARRIGLELDNLTAEVANLDDLVEREIPRVEGTLQDLQRMHDEMEALNKRRLPIVEETLTELEEKSQQAKKLTEEFNNETKTLYTKLQSESEKQKFRLENIFGEWRQKIIVELVELSITGSLVESLTEADQRVQELISEVDSFFKQEVVEPAQQHAEGLQDKIQLYQQNVDSATGATKEAYSWVDPIIADIERYTGPLDDLVAKARELARMFSPGGY